MYEPSSVDLVPVARALNWPPEYSRFPDSEKPYAYRVFDGSGRYVRYEQRTEQGHLMHADHFDVPWVRTHKTIFDARGAARRVIYMDRATNKAAFHVVFNGNGLPQVSSPMKSGQATSFFSHFDQKELRTEIELGGAWVSRVISSSMNPILFIEKREWVTPLSISVGADVTKVMVLHSSHLGGSLDDPKVIAPSMDDAFGELRAGRLSRLVVLTNSQRDDIELDPELIGLVSTIPHFQAQSSISEGARDPLKIVSLARYHHVKNLDAAIEIVALVRKQIPDVRYEIFGYGPEQARLQKLINDRGLEQNIFLKGHTDYPEAELARAKLLLFTSRSEGFGLAALEALASGTPVVALDTKYGPSEIIRDGVDGYVVQSSAEQIEVAASRVVEILLNDQVFTRMSASALEVSNRFSERTFQSQWCELLRSLE